MSILYFYNFDERRTQTSNTQDLGGFFKFLRPDIDDIPITPYPIGHSTGSRNINIGFIQFGMNINQ